MDDNKLLYSKSETIGVVQQRQLKETSRSMDRMLTPEEFALIISIYNKAVNRLLKENEVQ